MIDQEFIKRAEELFKNDVEEYLEKRKQRISDWNHKNREMLRRLIREYSRTDKGKIACTRRSSLRQKRFRDLVENLSEDEKNDIHLFYLNRPEGYEVDHVIPISRGGRHHRSNLQYLTKHENRKKHNRINAT